jgi:Parvovirus non-structural protein NS1
MSIQQSINLIHKWCAENNFPIQTLLADIFDVLERKCPKINTFCLHGPPNCEKSYLMRSLIAWFPFFGEAIGGGASYAFLWQDCVDTAVIFIEEPYITPAEVEQFKLVFEGAETHVHVKNKGDALLQPTPVIVTCNNLPWRWVMGEESALRARMRIYHCREMKWLKDENKYLNPQVWAYLYHLYRNVEDTEIQDATNALLMDNDDMEMPKTPPTYIYYTALLCRY